MTEREYNELYNTMYAVTRGRIVKAGLREVADDMAQSIYMRLWLKRDTITHPRTYLYIATSHKILDHVRVQKGRNRVWKATEAKVMGLCDRLKAVLSA